MKRPEHFTPEEWEQIVQTQNIIERSINESADMMQERNLSSYTVAIGANNVLGGMWNFSDSCPLDITDDGILMIKDRIVDAGMAVGTADHGEALFAEVEHAVSVAMAFRDQFQAQVAVINRMLSAVNDALAQSGMTIGTNRVRREVLKGTPPPPSR